MKIRIGFSFLLFNALLFIFRDSRLIFGFYAACIAHELGHIAAIRLTGGEVRVIELSCFGIRITASPSARVSAGVFVLLSGPAVNLLLYAALTLAGLNGYTSGFCLAEGIFNLLPFSFLDGGAVLDLLTDGHEYEQMLKHGIIILRVVAALTIFALIFCAIY